METSTGSPVPANEPVAPAATEAVLPAGPLATPSVPTGVSQTATVSAGGLNGPFPAELRGWNWGAFLMNWMWGIGHNVWVALLMFVPFVNFIVWIYLGIKGNELAWQHRKFDGVEQFRAVQKAWVRWGVILFVVGIAFAIVSAALSFMAASKLASQATANQNLYSTSGLNQ